MANEPTVLIADPLPLFAEAMAVALRARYGLSVLDEHPQTVPGVIAAVEKLSPDIILLDPWITGGTLPAAIKAITARNPYGKVILMSWLMDAEQIGRGLAAGASGFLSQDAALSVVADEIRRIAAGKPSIYTDVIQRALETRARDAGELRRRFESLARREVEILLLLNAGHSITEISGSLKITRRSVENRIAAILRKTETLTTTQAIALARSCRFLEE